MLNFLGQVCSLKFGLLRAERYVGFLKLSVAYKNGEMGAGREGEGDSYGEVTAIAQE